MERLTAPPLPAGCPWSGYTPPNVDWCEQELCAWIVNPADTWSNLAYFAAALFMWRAARGAGGGGLGLFAPATLFVGVASFVYHASYTYALQVLDFVGMFVFCFLLIALNARRLGWIAAGNEWLPFAAGVTGFTALLPFLFEAGIPIQGMVAVLILGTIGQELALARRSGGAGPYRLYLAALALLAAAGVFSLLDVTRTWCDPTSLWKQGHAIWHLLAAASMATLFTFYAHLGRGRSLRS